MKAGNRRGEGVTIPPVFYTFAAGVVCILGVLLLVLLFARADALGVWFWPLVLGYLLALTALLAVLLYEKSMRATMAKYEMTRQELNEMLAASRRRKRRK